jgi:SAM-dependent methyltransferase
MNVLNYSTKSDIIGWDVRNWAYALDFWEPHLERLPSGLALELGCGRNGGLSLYLALKGYRVICSGYPIISVEARKIHQHYGVEDSISYNIINALDIPYKNSLDIVCYKSMLGGIVREGDLHVAERVINSIYQALRPGGILIFAENLSASKLHYWLRSKYGSGKDKWRYFSLQEILKLHSDFSSFQYSTFGFLGLFGTSEKHRWWLGLLDKLLVPIIPQQWHYIVAGIALKGNVP